jgi:ABC-2 type transport system permease protein
MSTLIRAEARKARATPTIWWLLLGTAAIGVIGTLAPLIAADGTTDLLTDQKLQEAMHGAAAGSTLVLVAGIIAMAGEWRFGQASQTFLTTPRRRQVVSAKATVYLGVGAIYGIIAGIASTITATLWYRANDLALPLDRSAVWLTLLGCLAVSTAFGLLGVAIGAIARNQVVAIVAALGWLVLVEPALFAASPNTFRWLPGAASFSLRRQPAEGLLDAGGAALVLGVVITVAVAVGIRLVERDDVAA